VLFLAGALAAISAAVLCWLASAQAIPSFVRDPLSNFVQPGVVVWWLILGGPFRSGPDSAADIAFVAGANALLWLLVLWFVVVVCRAVSRKLAARHS